MGWRFRAHRRRGSIGLGSRPDPRQKVRELLPESPQIHLSHISSVQSRVQPFGQDDWEVNNQSADTTQLLFAEWDPDADQDHKEKLVKYGTAIFRELAVLNLKAVPESNAFQRKMFG